MANPTQSDSSPNLLSRAVDWLVARGWRSREVSYLSVSDLNLLAMDLGVTRADLLDVLPRGPDKQRLMDRMMQARGLDPDRVRRMGGAMVRDMELTCSRCASSGRCRRDLEAGVAAASAPLYCGNTEVFDELLAAQPKG